MKGFFDYVPGSSYLHRLNPMTKLLLALMICITAFISANHLFLIMR
jgi:energy-coupling factor transport system permease protein